MPTHFVQERKPFGPKKRMFRQKQTFGQRNKSSGKGAIHKAQSAFLPKAKGHKDHANHAYPKKETVWAKKRTFRQKEDV